MLSVLSIALLCRFTQAQTPQVFLWDAEKLAEAKRKILAGDKDYIQALAKLKNNAQKALSAENFSVVNKQGVPPSGDKHDYMSLAPYFWPNPATADGMPYIRKDGQTNPEVKLYKDKEYQPKLCESVYTLGLAYYYSGNKAYAKHAANLVRVWFLDSATRMNPNLNFAQAIKGQNTGRGAGMIDTRHYVKLIDGIGLLKTSAAWTDKDQQQMQQWFRDYLHWMQTSKIGIDEMNAANNHGAWYETQRMAIALYLDSMDLAKRSVNFARDRLDKQLDENGRFPREMERTISLHYTTFVMEAFFNMAKMAELTGDNLWNYTSPSGKSLKKAFDELKPYLAGKDWHGQQIKEFEWAEGYPILQEGYRHYGCKDCTLIIRNLAGDKAKRLRLKLLTDTDF